MKNGTISYYSKKGQADNLGLTILSLFIAGLVLVFGILMMERTNENLEQDFLGSTENSTYLAASIAITPKISSLAVYAYNDTFLSCDGTNDYIRITPSSNDTVTFWYNSSTSLEWQFIVNTFGVQYTNATRIDATEYPAYWDGTYYYFCKTDATTFWEGSIDKISIYDGQLNETEIGDLYDEERYSR